MTTFQLDEAPPRVTEYPFIAIYRDKRCEVHATTSLIAQQRAALRMKARKYHEVSVYRADLVHSAI